MRAHLANVRHVYGNHVVQDNKPQSKHPDLQWGNNSAFCLRQLQRLHLREHSATTEPKDSIAGLHGIYVVLYLSLASSALLNSSHGKVVSISCISSSAHFMLFQHMHVVSSTDKWQGGAHERGVRKTTGAKVHLQRKALAAEWVLGFD